MKLYIKNMVCNRCIAAVDTELKKQGLHPITSELGEVTIQEDDLSHDQLSSLDEGLQALGFELIDDRKSRIIEKIKNVIINLVHHTDEQPKQKYSELISKELHYDYPYLSKLFSEIEGITIEQYIINQKVERIKELITYDEMTLSEIAYKMGYSSVAHLSSQFKKVTGLPPSHFKNVKSARIALDKIGQNKS